MQINPTDKSISIIADIDFLLFGTSTTFNTDYSLTDRIRNVNNAWDEAVTELYKADPEYKWDDTTNTDFPIATVDLTAGLDHYTMLDAALVIHRVRMKDNGGTLRTLESVERRQLSDSQLNETGSPSHYYKMGGAIFPAPVPDYGFGDGVEIEFQRGANHFTIASTSESPGFNPQYHRFLSLGAALDYALANGMDKKAKSLSELKEAKRRSMVEHYERRSPDARPRLKLKRRQYTGL
jgi:hypothetical protein